jgi:hypothetical protein
MIHVTDVLNNQFMLFDYLSTINDSIIYYLENNNLPINYYCTDYNKSTSTHQLVTSNTNKKISNGYRYITVEELDNTLDNQIINLADKLVIHYENLIINISVPYNEKDITKFNILIINPHTQSANEKILTHTWYNKNVNENNIEEIYGLINPININLFKNVKKVTTYYDKNYIIYWPSSIVNLKLIIPWTDSLTPNIIPHNLHTLTLCCSKKILPNSLPPNLHTLILGTQFLAPLLQSTLPINLQILAVTRTYTCKIDSQILPPSLKIICFYNYTTKFYSRDLTLLNYTGEIYYKCVNSTMVYKMSENKYFDIPELKDI